MGRTQPQACKAIVVSQITPNAGLALLEDHDSFVLPEENRLTSHLSAHNVNESIPTLEQLFGLNGRTEKPLIIRASISLWGGIINTMPLWTSLHFYLYIHLLNDKTD